MSDIDFDELDREVNKLVGKDTPSRNIQSDVSAMPKEEPLDASEEIQGSAEEVVPDVSQKPRGRFMDVVHPSSYMSSGKDTFSNTAERKALQPIKDMEDSNDNEEFLDSVADEQHVIANSSSTDMPDPLALHEAREAEKASTSFNESSPRTEIESPSETATDSKDAPEAMDDNETQPNTLGETDEEDIDKREPVEDEQNEPVKETPTSVFIADAQTEKRPLGGIVKEDSSDNDEAQVLTGEVAIELPPELEKNLVAIEAGESPDDIPEPDTPIETPIEQGDVSEASKETETSEKPKQGSAINGLLASGSIPQQYRQAAEKIVQQDTHAKPLFFDAQHYATTPAIAAKKQKSGFMHVLQWVFIVIGLLLLGGTLGAAIFVFVNGQ